MREMHFMVTAEVDEDDAAEFLGDMGVPGKDLPTELQGRIGSILEGQEWAEMYGFDFTVEVYVPEIFTTGDFVKVNGREGVYRVTGNTDITARIRAVNGDGTRFTVPMRGLHRAPEEEI
jgi:hypothetical protein